MSTMEQGICEKDKSETGSVLIKKQGCFHKNTKTTIFFEK